MSLPHARDRDEYRFTLPVRWQANAIRMV